MRIIANKGGCAAGHIFNLGNPGNDCSIRELAELMVEVLSEFKGYEGVRERTRMEIVGARDYYGPDYQDMQTRVPDISNARTQLGWEPRVDLRESLRRTIAYYVERRVGQPRAGEQRA